MTVRWRARWMMSSTQAAPQRPAAALSPAAGPMTWMQVVPLYCRRHVHSLFWPEVHIHSDHTFFKFRPPVFSLNIWTLTCGMWHRPPNFFYCFQTGMVLNYRLWYFYIFIPCGKVERQLTSSKHEFLPHNYLCTSLLLNFWSLGFLRLNVYIEIWDFELLISHDERNTHFKSELKWTSDHSQQHIPSHPSWSPWPEPIITSNHSYHHHHHHHLCNFRSTCILCPTPEQACLMQKYYFHASLFIFFHIPSLFRDYRVLFCFRLPCFSRIVVMLIIN